MVRAVSGTIDVGTAAVLGAVQGATEFLPVSSDGHLAITAMLLGVDDEMPLAMVVLLHAGTLIATAAIFGKDLVALTRSTAKGVRAPRAWYDSDDGKLVLGVIVASIPTAVIGLLLEPHVEAFSRVKWIVGAGLLGSALAVLATRKGGGTRDVLPLHYVLIVGVAQGCAVMPGLTRSGMTIAVGMLLGLSGPAAFRFSFLLSLPAVFGAIVLELRHTEALAQVGVPTLCGAIVALIVGYLALRTLRTLVDRGRFWIFALYLVPLGLALIVWDFVG
jgi:undecaprenyl-diphosphatase